MCLLSSSPPDASSSSLALAYHRLGLYALSEEPKEGACYPKEDVLDGKLTVGNPKHLHRFYPDVYKKLFPHDTLPLFYTGLHYYNLSRQGEGANGYVPRE